MAIRNEQQCTVEGLNLFEPPLYQTAIKSSEWVEVRPITGLDRSTSTIKVYYQGKSGISVDLSQTIVTFTTRIVKVNSSAAGRLQAATVQGESGGGGSGGGGGNSGAKPAQPTTAPTGNDNETPFRVGVVNYPVGSVFQSVDLEMNGRNVCTSNNNYAHRAYIEVLSSYSMGAKNKWLKCGGYFDNTKTPDSRPLGQPQAAGLERTAMMYGSEGNVTWSGRLHLDMCSQGRHVLPNVNMMFTFVMNPAKFILQYPSNSEGGDYELVISDFSLKFLECTLSDSEQMRIESQLIKGPALYPITRVDVRSFNIGTGTKAFSEDNCFVGQLPNRILVAMVTDRAFTGTYTTSPFNYQPFGVDYIQLVVGGRAVPPLPLLPNKLTGASNDEYLSVMAGLGILFDDKDIGISPDEWHLNGNTIYVFNVTPHMPNDCVSPPVQGNVRLQMRFASALAEPTVVVLYAEFANMIMIDKNRGVTQDF